MLLQGSISSDKTEILAKNYAKLLNSGVDSSKILVILQNSSKKGKFIENVLAKLKVDVVEKLQIYSFFGLVYNTISDNWAYIENTIPVGKTSILPNLTGLEVSQFILKDIIKDVKFEGYNSKKSLLHQLFRRYSLIVQNNLTENGVKWRSEEVLGESFAPDAKKALDEFKKKTLEVRGFDYLRQSLIFNHIYKNTDYFSNIEYVFVDDGDEITPICFDFLKFLKPQLKEAYIAYDKPGGSRLGYLSAEKTAGVEFEQVFEEEPKVLDGKSFLLSDAQTVFSNVIDDRHDKLKNFSLSSFSKRAQMIDFSVKKIKKLIDNGIKPSQITLITPIIDDMLKFCLRENLKSNWANLFFLSGSEKIIQNPLVHTSLVILKLADENLKHDLTEFDIRGVLCGFLGIPVKYCKEVFEKFEIRKKLEDIDFSNLEYDKKYKDLLKVVENLSKSEKKLSEQVFEVYENLVDLGGHEKNEINKFNFFIKGIEDFENVFSPEEVKNRKNEIINQFENSIISENPYSTLEIGEDDLVIATPQKIIDNQVQTKYQIWLDVSSDEWIKSDTGPLYNAWVFQSGWEKDKFELQDNIELSKQKTARILRKLMLCAEEKIFGYASLFDGSGIENFGGIEKYLNFEVEQKPLEPAKQIIPRDDQKPVLDYEKGSMAISAVPGAGKTTILLSLIVKLLNKGINPENIFVLTYMESAARNFRERIQNSCQDCSQLPNISTIHGLALKILKENANYERLGLNADFEICDDSQRSKHLREISAKLEIKTRELEDFDRAVSVKKMGGAIIPSPPEKSEKEAPKASRYYSQKTLNQAKALRKIQTDAEQLIWFLLRDRQFCDLKFRRQAPIGKYIVDFICLEKKLIIELDGSGHLQTDKIIHDENRRKFIENEGYKIIGFYNYDIVNNLEAVLEKIYTAAFEEPLTPTLSPKGRGSDGYDLSQAEKKNENKANTSLALWGRGKEFQNEERVCEIQGEGSINTPQRKPKTAADAKKLEKFLNFFEEYDRVLKSNNLIDYDDMLIFSVRLLEENSDIRAYYQELCQFIIEDEAQDSSAIQQRLINLLSAKHKNLIRCGDINQAITTTFSNADVEGFREFIETSDTTVSMDCSQRCTEDVWKFANSLIPFAENSPHTKKSFYKIFMRPVDGKNPVEKHAITPIIFDNDFAEKNYVLKQIKTLLSKNPKLTFGILLRNNYQVAKWTKFINDAGLKSITRSECLEQKGVFRAIFAILKIILSPFDNENVANSYDILAELGHYKPNMYAEIKNLEKPFVQINADDIKNLDLVQFYWDITYWLSFTNLSVEELAIKIGLYYYSSEVEKSNVYLISTLIKRLSISYGKFLILMERLEELSKKPSLSGFKFFSEEDESSREFLAGKVQIMTLHKSKGDEFDCVFLPEMAEKNLTLDFDELKLKSNARFMENVRELNPAYETKSDDELKEFLLAENFRLLYVAITRAQRKLFITASKTAKPYGKIVEQEPSVIFSILKTKGEFDE